MNVVIVDSGVANLASVSSAFTALNAPHCISSDPEIVREATHVVLPGVGRFEAGMAALRSAGLDRALLDVHERGTPLLAICLGLQMLSQGSDESPGVPGLGIFPAWCTRLPDTVPVPHLGWNRVVTGGPGPCGAGASGAACTPGPSVRVGLRPGEAAFANSYCITRAPEGWRCAWTTHGVEFVSAMTKGRTLGCQFHPELSGSFGIEVIRDWLRGGPGVPAGTDEAGRRTRGVLPRIVPCLDVEQGRVVKGVRFTSLRDSGDPAERASEYQRQGADEIVLLDISASPTHTHTRLDTVARVRTAIHIPLTVGGGVRSVDDARALLAAGADKVSVNTAAVRDPQLLTLLSQEFGTQCVVLAIDAKRLGPSSWEVLVMGGREGTGLDVVDWAIRATQGGAGEILLTSWDQDGTREGCDLALLRAVRRAVSVPVIASGGIGSLRDVKDALDTGVNAVLAASVLHDDDFSVADVKAYLTEMGLEVRS